MSIQLARSPSVVRTATATATATVSLHDFKVEEVVEWLQEQGYSVNGVFSERLLEAGRNAARHVTMTHDDDDTECSGLLIPDAEIASMETLLWCGQRETVRDDLMRLLTAHLGRNFEVLAA